jgi:hypothetical protein
VYIDRVDGSSTRSEKKEQGAHGGKV